MIVQGFVILAMTAFGFKQDQFGEQISVDVNALGNADQFTTKEAGTCDGDVDFGVRWVANVLASKCEDITTKFKWSRNHRVVLTAARRRSVSPECFHPSGWKSRNSKGKMIAYLDFGDWPENEMCGCFEKFFNLCGEMSASYECMMEHVCHCESVCPDFKACLGCSSSLVEAAIDKRSNSKTRMTRSVASSQSGNIWSSMISRWTKRNEDQAREDGDNLDQTTDGKCS